MRSSDLLGCAVARGLHDSSDQGRCTFAQLAQLRPRSLHGRITARIAGLILLAPHILFSSNPDGTALGGPLAIIGTIGLATLAVWSVLPRWRDMAPARFRQSILSVREFPLVRTVSRFVGGYERWRTIHRTTGLFVAAGFFHGLLDGTAFDSSSLLRWSYVAIGGIGVFYREAGPRQAPAILLLHGFPTSSHMYRNLIPLLADQFHLVIPSPPGFGFSTRCRRPAGRSGGRATHTPRS